MTINGESKSKKGGKVAGGGGVEEWRDDNENERVVQN